MGSLRVWNDWLTSLSLFTFIHWWRKWQPTPVFLPGESQGRGSLGGCCLWGHTESDTTEATAAAAAVWLKTITYCCFPVGSDSKESACNAGPPGSVPVSGRPPGEGNGNLSWGILAWGIPWTEEPGELQSKGSQRVGHNWGTNTFTFTHVA